MVVRKISAIYTLNKAKRVLRQVYRLYKRKAKTLDAASSEKIQSNLKSLQTAILQKDARIASQIAAGLEETSSRLLARTPFDRAKDFTCAILFALFVAVIIRTMWFEPYTIPTGSMRPTVKEGDFLVVTKSDYGINVPLTPRHFYFDPKLVQRGAVFVFTGEGMDIQDSDTLYFYLFPGKKQFVKRLIAKPGDTLYFYGGQIYGIDAQGKELQSLLDPPWFTSLEHIPFIRFDGKVETPNSPKQGLFPTSVFYQMNEPIAKLTVTPIGTIDGEIIPQKGQKSPLPTYGDIWGFKNYAMARLLTPTELAQLYPNTQSELGSSPLYLELTHHPSLQNAKIVRDEQGRLRPDLGHSVSLLPLNQKHIERIASHMTTCRFVVSKGVAYRYGMNPKDPTAVPYLPRLPNVPDGTYEIQDGKAYRVLWGSITTLLPPDHPLYNSTPERIHLLYNLGIEFVTYYNPSKASRIYPSRYAYFRGHDLYLLGAPIVKKDDPELILFLKSEYQKQAMSTSVRPYAPFDDAGPPLTEDGHINADFIRKYGLVIPEGTYLALGDNHAMSADSRQFGFVPENNIRGSATFHFWPPGSRWGRLPQPPMIFLSFPNLFVWISALAISLASALYIRRKLQKPLKF
jgi:signal peptidase I